MIGGTDIVIPTKGDCEALDACVRIIREYWPQATFENALTAEKHNHYEELPFGHLRELFVYPDAVAEKAWDQGEANAATNSMLYLILSPDHVTVVLDDPNTEPMRSMLKSIQSSLAMDLLNTYAEAA
jgi:hypothetical protein